MILVKALDPWPQGEIEVDHIVYTRPKARAKYDTVHYQDMNTLMAQKGVTEIIFVDEKGFIREGNVTNIFFVFPRSSELGVRSSEFSYRTIPCKPIEASAGIYFFGCCQKFCQNLTRNLAWNFVRHPARNIVQNFSWKI